MDTNSSLDNIITRVKSVTKQVIDRDDHDRVLYSCTLTPEEYVAEMAGYLYRRHVTKSSGLRLRMAHSYEVGVHYVASASESNGIRTTYQLHIN